MENKKEFFPEIGKIKFEGKESKNPLAFRYYDAEKVVYGRKMKDWFKFSMAYWHTMCAESSDPFGGPTKSFPWNREADPIERQKTRWMPLSNLCKKSESNISAFTTLTWWTKEIRSRSTNPT
jgi:xylose isomerase